MQMDGQAVFKFAVKRVPEAVKEVLEKNNIFLTYVLLGSMGIGRNDYFFLFKFICLEQRDFNMIGSIISKIIKMSTTQKESQG